ncbi:hypothetical protein [Ancylobacter mangrovi]|uniref:hypothetical protein n=1 Tax=Ancylobacter mangrovi TaxID=2972472 RepID=UPI002163F69C|nr:hypothetical protein [Ancylobacter mangrovi]MCS0505339.1 hypothetical protein [Ancylobacter mangrovi]
MVEYLTQYLGRFDHMTLLAIAVAAAVVIIIALRWTGQRYVAPKARLALSGDGSFEYGVAGADAHQPALGRIAGRNPPASGQECLAELIPEAAQTGELTAIWVRVEEARVGHVAVHEIVHFEKVLKGRAARCDAIVVGSARSGLQLRLDLVWPPQLREPR